MRTITTSNSETDFILETLLKAAAPCSIYVFGSRGTSTLQPETKKSHYDILVFANTKVTGSHLMNEIKMRTDKTITATVLVHKVTQLTTQQKSQQYFFDQVLRYGQRIALDKANVPYILNHNPERDLETDTRFWHKCVAVAQFNIHAAKDSPQAEVGLCKIALLNTACVQMAIGLIRVFLGYTPNEFGLKYLLQLCGHFTDLPQQVFACNTENDIRLYKMLCAPASMLLHWTKLGVEENDFEVLLQNCERFLEKAGALAIAELNRLETLKT
ncbi:hypothetical protein [Flavobacterium sp. 102]|uniref:hypothetical protein n=1 Tax=Flavobacterium sp. 102 TaxID=2135623 RepID=UPI000EB30FCD|nr:hypothetical protein [Flavobacterium sp. 102]RKS01677.1 hypothetical protein C8C84_1354 [Flavobacterium sp. 102]